MINFYTIYNKPLELDLSYLMDDLNKLMGWGIRTGDNCSMLVHIIKRHPVHAYWYAIRVIKGRWIEAEPYIMKDTRSAYMYATCILNGRWLEAESYIQTEATWWESYRRYFNL